jgi:hypothetical protein
MLNTIIYAHMQHTISPPALRANQRASTEFFIGLVAIPLTLALGGLAAVIAQLTGHGCTLKMETGLPCPSCGSTRALYLILSGEFVKAFTMQPLLTTLGIGALAYSLYAFAVVFLGTARIQGLPRSPSRRRRLMFLVFFVIAANWAFLMIKGH